MIDDWSLIMDDWWLITDDWWLMIDDWWLMSDEWCLMIDDKINTNIIWNVRYRLPQGGPPLGQTIWGTFHIIFVFILSSIINHHSSLINHQSSIISHQSSVINHQSSMINAQSSVINHHTIWVPGIPGPGALGSRGPEPWDPGALRSLLHVFVTKSVGNRFPELSYSRKWPPRSRDFENRGFGQKYQEKTRKIKDFTRFSCLWGRIPN